LVADVVDGVVSEVGGNGRGVVGRRGEAEGLSDGGVEGVWVVGGKEKGLGTGGFWETASV
jgi:hypothetical protein